MFTLRPLLKTRNLICGENVCSCVGVIMKSISICKIWTVKQKEHSVIEKDEQVTHTKVRPSATEFLIMIWISNLKHFFKIVSSKIGKITTNLRQTLEILQQILKLLTLRFWFLVLTIRACFGYTIKQNDDIVRACDWYWQSNFIFSWSYLLRISGLVVELFIYWVVPISRSNQQSDERGRDERDSPTSWTFQLTSASGGGHANLALDRDW